MYTAVARRCTRSVHAMNGRVHGRVHGHIHGTYTAVHTAVNTAVYTVCTRPWAAVYNCARPPVHGPCTWSVRVPNTAVYAASTWQNTAGYAARTGPCTYRIHGRARAVNRVRVQGTRPCTRPSSGHGRTMHGRVHGTYTAVHTGRKDGRRYTAHARPCIRYVHGCVHGRVLPRTGCVHGRVRDTDGPCAWPEGGRAQSVHGRPRPCTDCVHGRARATYMVRP